MISVQDLGKRAHAASEKLRLVSTKDIDTALQGIADGLRKETMHIIDANQDDVDAAKAAGLSLAVIDRLTLDDKRIESMAQGVEAVKALEHPLGKTVEERTPANGLKLKKVRVPLGVIGFIYESRPNVTVDAAILAIKSGNAIILRGGKEAIHSNTILVKIIAEAIELAGLPKDSVQLLTDLDHARVDEMLRLSEYINLMIPRGGRGLIDSVTKNARMPVLKHERGICHTYVDKDADLDMAVKIAFDAKMQRTGVCNATETLLVHSKIASEFLPVIAKKLKEAGCELRGDPRTKSVLPDILAATEDDWSTEYLDAVLSIKIVSDISEAIEHINKYGSGHTDAIISENKKAIEEFFAGVDSAAVIANASTRLHDGYEFGMGAEIGISTDKFHARGPVGLEELTSYKWLAEGKGQTRG